MRSSNSKMIGNGITANTGTPVENGLPPKEENGIADDDVHTVAAKVVENVVRLASVAARDADRRNSSPKMEKRGNKSLPTIQIDTVPSPLSSPTELSPVSAQSNEEILDASHIDIELEEVQPPESQSDDLRESLKSYIEDILSKAMVVAEKKIELVDFGGDNETENEREKDSTAPQQSPMMEPEEKISGEPDDDEIRAAAEKVVEEVLSKAQDTVIEQMEQFEKEIAALDFPDLPSIQIDTVISAPPSPEIEEEPLRKPKKFVFKMNEDSGPPNSVTEAREKLTLITFEEAPECVKDVASNFVKDIVGKAVAQAEEKSAPTTAPFTFEDVDLMKTNGPWYIRVREAFVRVLRTACFCTPRRNDS
ncbi:uncharacterized protein [Parasteatoda tepidariorum]|uniref:uncharacterized protein isoform X2 n=1 Tax=Parasteatoda tepidariorum TaxID=114398 RepID=UPI00077FE024|nr:uncharacterized protein LOC107436690 isoform X2 [Parasteatoda tepidariorum]